jgi:hypothetical protein
MDNHLGNDPPLRLEWREPGELADNPANWRRHPQQQLDALRDVIAEVGWAGVCLYHERTGRLIDGHARKQVAKGKVPVLIGSWDEAQEAKILATLDPLAAMAEANREALAALLPQVDSGSAALQQMLAGLAEGAGLLLPGSGQGGEPPPEDFASYGEDIQTAYRCPKCGYEWSGKPK